MTLTRCQAKTTKLKVDDLVKKIGEMRAKKVDEGQGEGEGEGEDEGKGEGQG